MYAMRSQYIILGLILALTIFSSQFVNAAIVSPDENGAKRYVSEKLINNVKFWDIKNMTVGLYNGSEKQLFNRVCPVNLIWNDTTEQCQRAVPIVTPPPVPITCPVGYHVENNTCVKDAVTPPTPTPTTIPVINTSKTLRIAIVGDVDDNSGLTTQVNLAKKYNAEYFVIPGDYAYSSASGVKSKVSAGYSSDKVIVAVGNHDSASAVKSWMGISTNYYEKYVKDAKLQFIVADGNTGFGCTTTQFTTQKKQIEDSDAWYKVFVIHQPFATVKSDHGPNGQFNCYNTVFQSNGVDLVAQAHNHNWQLGDFDKMWYGVFGTGTHDTGSSMYGCDSTTFNNVNMNCKTGTNGVTFVDFPIDKQGTENIYFVSNADKLVYSAGGQ